MPIMANVTVKKYDNTTDVVYYAMNTAGADGTVALWRAPALNGTVASQPYMESWSRWNGPRTARRIDFRGAYPQALTDTNTGLVVVRNQAMFQASWLMPISMDQTSLNECSAQFSNFCVQASVREAIRLGFSFT